jgi:hypothetical protein
LNKEVEVQRGKLFSYTGCKDEETIAKSRSEIQTSRNKFIEKIEEGTIEVS